jgi:diguanylate cyclase (GGDEF)-like protein
MRDAPARGSGLTVRMKAADGWRWVNASWQLVHDDDPAVPDEIVVSLRDVHDERLRAQQLAHASRRDELTGALNRAGLEDELQQLADRGQTVLVAFVDIDDFKSVNDTHGHDAGDTVLRSVADALHRAVRSSDHVARVGGDEFCVIVVDDDGEHDPGTLLADRLLLAVRASLAEHRAAPTISMGIAGPAPATEVAQLRTAADAAMYRAKGDGGDRCELAPPF